MMSEEEDNYDELPPITVNSPVLASNKFNMPRADELASQRAREVHCEREILRMREMYAESSASVSSLPRSESSESEGEAALAGAVAALRMTPSRMADARELADELAPRLPPAPASLLREYARSAPSATDEVLESIYGMLYCDARGPRECLGAGAWLCCVLAAGGGGAAGTRAAHTALRAGGEALASALCGVGGPWGARELLRLAGALRGGPPAATALTAALLAAAAERLLGDDLQTAGALERRFQSLSAAQQCTALAVAARGAAGAGGLSRLLAVAGEGGQAGVGAGADALRLAVIAAELRALLPAP